MKNKAKELLSDITDARHARADRRAGEHADDAVGGTEVSDEDGRQREPAGQPVQAADSQPRSDPAPVQALDLDRNQPQPVDQHHGPGQHHDQYPDDSGRDRGVGERGPRDGDRAPSAATAGSGTTPAAGEAERRVQLVPADRAESYRSRWNAVKGDFVDEPRQAVVKADSLVGEFLEELEQLFHDQRRSIEYGLDKDETSTEDLRIALRRYRSFFDRLLSL
jgi:hypothetical protein